MILRGYSGALAVSQYYDLPVVNLRHVLINHVLEHENLIHEFFHAKAPYPEEWPDDTRHVSYPHRSNRLFCPGSECAPRTDPDLCGPDEPRRAQDDGRIVDRIHPETDMPDG